MDILPVSRKELEEMRPIIDSLQDNAIRHQIGAQLQNIDVIALCRVWRAYDAICEKG